MFRIIVFISLILFISCSSADKKKQSAENIYASLMLAMGDSSFDKMQCVAEFTREPDDLKKIALKKEAKVLLDNEPLRFDDTYYPTYDLEKEASAFPGKHTWTIEPDAGIKKTYELEVVLFRITSEIPGKMGISDVKVECENLKSTDKVTLLLTANLSDTSESFLEITPADGHFIIPADFLKKVDPIQLDLHFNIARIKSVKDDDYFGKGVDIEYTVITRRFTTKIER